MNSVNSFRCLRGNSRYFIRDFSSSHACYANQKCRVLVVGGGSGGISVAAKLSYRFGAGNVTILEASEKHYYQPLFTLIGGGMKKLEDSFKPTKDVIPPLANWIMDKVESFDAKSNKVTTRKGDVIEYDFMVIAAGLKLRYDLIPGLEEALSIPKGQVCSIYSAEYVDRTFEALKNFRGGNVICTFPNSPIKCPGAPQKICYIADDYLRKTGKRKSANIFYNTSLANIFGVKYYADALWPVAKKRDITVNLRTNLAEVLPNGRQAIFENLDTKERTTVDFGFLHVTPPMTTPRALNSHAGDLVNEAGFVDVNKWTMRHKIYPNVFALGDCSATPNSKTAAACAAQTQVVYKNLSEIMQGREPIANYNGYASCPIVTGYKKCILAEFDYDLQPLETFPIDSSRERYSMHFMKKELMAPLYWHLMLNGLWNGPGFIRNYINVLKNL